MTFGLVTASRISSRPIAILFFSPESVNIYYPISLPQGL